MEHAEVVLLGLLVAVAGLVLLAGLLKVPYPVMLVLGGLALGFVPGLPRIELAPEVVLLLFLPPLLYSAAFFSSLRDLRDNLSAISLLAVGLVLATAVSVALVAHLVIGMSWPVAFVLGAIVSPTDPVAATAIARRVGIPRGIVSVVEGESLVNDATALIAYRFAVGAVATGAFSLWQAGVEFVVGAVGGVALGMAVGWVVAQVRRRLDDPPVEITISLFTPYAAYLPAEELGLSGVLAAVTVGIYLGWRAPALITPSTRIQSYSIWEILIFLLNSLLFVLIGLQLPAVLDGLTGGESARTLAGWGLLVSAVVIVTRLAWVFLLTYLPRWLSPSLRRADPSPSWRSTLLVAWSGMRGAVSLAAALAVPLVLPGGEAFPARDLVLFLTFSVILVTLLAQGLTLPALVRLLGVRADSSEREEEVEARVRTAEAALARLDELAEEEWVREDTAERMRGLYDYRRRRFAAQRGDADGSDGEGYEERSAAYARLRAKVLAAERAELVRLRGQGTIGDEVMRRVERDLDLEQSRLESPIGGAGGGPPKAPPVVVENARAVLQRPARR
jgi:CPA1 family monovalent cation:H+ antiporter